MATTTTVPELTRAQLVQIARTGREVKGVPRMRALAALQQRARKDYADVLLEVAADRESLPRYRAFAAEGLYRLGGARGRDALLAAAREADAAAAPTIAVGLGRIGTADDMPAVERLHEKAPAHARDRIRFAATLLAYRHSLDEPTIRAPQQTTLQKLTGKDSRLIQARAAPGRDASLALDALTDEPLDVDLTTDRAVRIDCEPNTFVWLWTTSTREAGFAPLFERKAIAGVLFRKRPFVNAYALSAIALGTPTRSGAHLTVHRASTGAILYAGAVGKDGSVELFARDRPGVAAIRVRARVDAGTINVDEARSEATSRPGRSPKPA